MILFSLLWWLGWIFSIFFDFTFTDPEDFLPLGSLLLGLFGAMCLKLKKQPKPSSVAFYVLMLILSCWPILPLIGLYFLASEYQSLFGTWPEPMVNDPKHKFGAGYVTYDNLFSLVAYLEAIAGSWLVVFFTLFFGNQARFSKLWRWGIIASCCLAILVYILDFGALYTWWLD